MDGRRLSAPSFKNKRRERRTLSPFLRVRKRGFYALCGRIKTHGRADGRPDAFRRGIKAVPSAMHGGKHGLIRPAKSERVPSCMTMPGERFSASAMGKAAPSGSADQFEIRRWFPRRQDARCRPCGAAGMRKAASPGSADQFEIRRWFPRRQDARCRPCGAAGMRKAASPGSAGQFEIRRRFPRRRDARCRPCGAESVDRSAKRHGSGGARRHPCGAEDMDCPAKRHGSGGGVRRHPRGTAGMNRPRNGMDRAALAVTRAAQTA